MNNNGIKYALLAFGAFLLGRKLFANDNDTTEGGGSGGDGVSGSVVPATEAYIRAGLFKVLHEFGRPIAENVERIYRLETSGFTSGQFVATNTAGQVATSASFPFGWSPRGTTPADYAPTVVMAENQGGAFKRFVAFKHFDTAARFLAQVMRDRGNDPGKWKTLAGSSSYREAAARIVPIIVNTL